MARTIISFWLSRILASAAWLSMVAAFAVVGMWQWESYREATDQRNVDRLNRMVSEYRNRTGRNPDLNMIELFRVGISNQRLHQTPYGGTYQIDPARMVVYNPHRMER